MSEPVNNREGFVRPTMSGWQEQWPDLLKEDKPSAPAEGVGFPRRPWVLSKQYHMTFVLSQDNEIILAGDVCRRLGVDTLRVIVDAVNAYPMLPEVKNPKTDAEGV